MFGENSKTDGICWAVYEQRSKRHGEDAKPNGANVIWLILA